MAALLLSKGFFRIKERIELKPKLKRGLTIVGVVLVAWFPVAVSLKAANEPLLSNMWMIYSQGEVQTVAWGMTHLENSIMWTGVDARIKDAYLLEYEMINGNVIAAYMNFANVRHIVYSEKDVLRAERTGFPLPPVFGWLQVYDNGEVQFLKKPPVTPSSDELSIGLVNLRTRPPAGGHRHLYPFFNPWAAPGRLAAAAAQGRPSGSR
jgi:hypothetical protein